ncbi:retrovirus-related pol polyprotein from transposon tnt 1-94 [Lasius niger]|uniref:Retrovirus-related pol polyprotein from transposon tnt 1-94 n=1 Tax=Lasius niger TaxID=67767 RepID=A0A0J7KBE4_LASNI|nr:retrovirus-related pol polyprotein from transposon tnt 1-94 [Lasius niger]
MVKQILRYIKGTAAMGIRYEANRRAYQLEGYSDANYASDPNSRKSVSGILFKYSGGAITWASKRQQSVSLSTLESEYIAASEDAKEAVWLNRLFSEIAPLKTVPVLLVDNAGAIKLAKSPSFHKRSKHIDIRYHFVRERIQKGQIMLEYVPSEEQAADILTKLISRI